MENKLGLAGIYLGEQQNIKRQGEMVNSQFLGK